MNDDLTILAFDVGIIHLAYCLYTKKDNKIFIIDWNNIDLSNRNLTKCHCGLKASYIHNNNHFCKVHSKKCEIIKSFEELFLEKKDEDQKCSHMIKDKICGRKISYLNNECYLCKTHAKSRYKSMENLYKVKPFKNKSIASMEFDDTRLKLFKILDEKKILLKANVVIIENQPSFKNPTMKSISNSIYDFFIIRGLIDKEITNSNIDKVKFFSPSNKMKLINDDDTQELANVKNNESKTYKITKELAIKYCLNLISHLPEWNDFLNKQKKKDDLADACLMAHYYYEKNIKQ